MSKITCFELENLTIHHATVLLSLTSCVVALVFGSLEILGNPTGFVRSIGSGVADMIWLPYEGLTKGPGPCISGFGGGMRSVARHFSAGQLRLRVYCRSLR